jgi:tRNA A-37 threonylcarbamoyl transferase component Bud32
VILAPGARVGPYQIVSAIGRGGVGEVYLADDPRLRRQVALKILNAKFADDESARGRFLREAQMAAGLDHPNICTLHEIGTDGGLDYLVMQRLRGETLAQRFERGRVPLRESLDIAVQLADALAFAHDHGVIHRDIKPQNVMLTPEGRVKLMDFGLAKAPGRLDDQQETHAALTEAGVFLGTLAYMSPEQLEGHPADERSDIFSLGMTLYELFAGRHPFSGPTPAATITAIASRPAAPLAVTAPDAPPGLTPIMAKALALRADERYQSTRDLLTELESARRGDPIATVPVAPAVRRPWTRRAILAGTAAGAVALALAAWLLPWPRQTASGPPAKAAAPLSPEASAFASWLEVQPAGPGVAQRTYESVGGDTVRNGSKFRVHVVPNAPGWLYIVSDERALSRSTQELTLLYPMADETGEVRGPTATGAYVVSGPAADTWLWVVWSRTQVRELDALKPLVNASAKGVVRDRASADGVRRMLDEARTRSTAAIDEGSHRVTARASGSVVAHRYALQQR